MSNLGCGYAQKTEYLWQSRLPIFSKMLVFRATWKCYMPHQWDTLLLTVCQIRAESEVRCRWGYDRFMSWHLKCIRMIAAMCISPTSEMLCANCLKVIAQELCLANDFTKDLAKPHKLMSNTASELLRTGLVQYTALTKLHLYSCSIIFKML